MSRIGVRGILVKTYGQAGDLDKVLAAWDEMEACSWAVSHSQAV